MHLKVAEQNGETISKEPQKDFSKPELARSALPNEEKRLAGPKEQEKIAPEKHELLTEATAHELEETLKRLQAEFENYQKRTQKDYAERFDLGKMDFAKSMLMTLDEFENALSHLKSEDKKGVEMIFNSFRKTLAEQGVRPMVCIGQKFDPYLHDVIKQEESEKDDGVIIAEVKKGYYFKDKVLRHAAVVISKKKVE